MAAPLRLPAAPQTTHQTDGLTGFPAVDNFAPAGTTVLAPVGGQIVDVHMIPWNQKQRVGGETAYLQGDDGKTYFLTHLAGNVPSGRVTAGQPIGQVAVVPGGAWQPHIHEGVHEGIYQPGGSTAAPAQAAGAFTAPQLERLWIKAGGSPRLAPTMAAIALAESSGHPGVVNDNPHTGDYSVGLWQINYFGNLAPSRTARYGSPTALQGNPLAQAKAAVNLAQGGKGLGNWSTYNSGAYRQYLTTAPPAATLPPTAPGAPVAHGAAATPPAAAPRAPVAPPPVAPPPTAPAGDHTDTTDLALQLLTRQQPAPFQPTQAPIGSTNIPAVHIEAPNAGTSPPVVQAIRLAQLHAQDSAGPSTTASFAKWLHNADGLLLPGSLHGQLTAGTEQTSPTPLPRDLLFFGNGAPTHQGISTGGHTFLHFSHGGRTIHISSLANPHYGNSLRSVRSLFG